MRYLSVCSGIEAASVAWHPLGFTPVGFSEIERFPAEVLAHHYGSNLPGEAWSHNAPPNFGDMTKFKEWPDADVDVLVGGTPCQSFSVAGLRKGLADPRGNLALTYLAIADKYRPKWILWENVPGVLSSDGGRDFGAFLGGLVELGYGFAYRVLDAQFVRVDGFGRAVPQRRRRVFVVGCLGDWRRAAAVLFDAAGMYGDSAPRREAGKGAAPTLAARTRGGGGLGTDFDCDGGLVCHDVAPTLNAHFGDKQGLEDQHINGGAGLFVAHAFKASHYTRDKDGAPSLVAPPLSADADKGDQDTLVCAPVAYRTSPNCGAWETGDRVDALTTGTDPTSHLVACAIQAGALRENPNSGPDGVGVQEGIAYTLEARAEVQAVQNGWAVRRLTPMECERLQGFPDGYTLIPRKGGKPAFDGPRYKALGNSMAVNVMRWIGQRIVQVEAIKN